MFFFPFSSFSSFWTGRRQRRPEGPDPPACHFSALAPPPLVLELIWVGEGGGRARRGEEENGRRNLLFLARCVLANAAFLRERDCIESESKSKSKSSKSRAKTQRCRFVPTHFSQYPPGFSSGYNETKHPPHPLFPSG